jgi:hypothetical protein
LIFGGLKEEVPIYIITEGISFPSPVDLGIFPSGSLGTLGVVIVDYSCVCGVLASVAFLGASN